MFRGCGVAAGKESLLRSRKNMPLLSIAIKLGMNHSKSWLRVLTVGDPRLAKYLANKNRGSSSPIEPVREKFEDNDMFNLDETGLFWQVLPENTMQFKGQKCHGGKKSKQRITLLLGANATGSMKLPLLAIGKSAKPRCFTGIKDLPVQYTANKKAWMTSDIFIQYLQKMDALFRRQQRHVCFILDNCPAHPRKVSGLTNTELHSSDDETEVFDELPVPKPSIASALNALLTLQQYMHYETGEFSESFDRIEDFLRRQAIPRHQTSIKDFSAN